MQNETPGTIMAINALEMREKNPLFPVIYKKRFERKQAAYNLGHFEPSVSNTPQVFTLQNGEQFIVSAEMTDISDEFFSSRSGNNYFQNRFWDLLKRIHAAQQISNIRSATAIDLESSGFDPDIEVSISDTTVKDAIGDVKEAQSEINQIVINDLANWINGLDRENKKVLLKKIYIPSLKITLQTIIIGNVETTHDFWSVDEQIVNMLYFLQNTLHLSTPENIHIFVVATLDSELPNTHQHSTDLIDMLDVLGFNNQNDAIIFEQAAVTMDQNSGKMIKVIDSLTSQVRTTHEVAHSCDANKLISTEPQCEAFAVALHVGMNFQRAIGIVVANYPQHRVSSKDFEELFSATPSEHLKTWQVYGLSATLYCYIYEQFGPQKFVQFYQEITQNKQQDNLLSALQSIGASDEFLTFIDTINQAIAKAK